MFVGDGQNSQLVLAKYTMYNNNIDNNIELNMIFERYIYMYIVSWKQCGTYNDRVALVLVLCSQPFTGKHDIYKCAA